MARSVNIFINRVSKEVIFVRTKTSIDSLRNCTNELTTLVPRVNSRITTRSQRISNLDYHCYCRVTAAAVVTKNKAEQKPTKMNNDEQKQSRQNKELF